MTLVVADTSPVRYLVLVGAIESLAKLYDSVVIPTAVLSELTHPAAPETVRAWAAKLPAWIIIQSPSATTASLNLGLGELEAIALAMELKATTLLPDDRHAEAAVANGLHVAGTIGILEQAALAGLLDLKRTLDRLRQTNFRGDENLFAEAIARHEAQRGNS